MKEQIPPIMGWSSWNYFRQSIDEDKILAIAQAMKQSGLSKVGYEYINLDDCWHSSKRSQQGELQFDLTNFPNGSRVIDEIHQLGLKVGLYSSCGVMTCEDLPGSFGNEVVDANTFSQWNVDFLKYDYCHVVDLKSDEKWLIDSPYVVSLEFYNKKTKVRTHFGVETGQLSGKAQLNQEEISFVSGLEKNQGRVGFNACLSEGDYVVTVEYKKRATEKRQLLLLKLNQQEIVMYFPTSSGWSLTGREQVEISLDTNVTSVEIFNPVKDQKSDAILRYKTMSMALEKAYAAQIPIVFAICEHGRNEPWRWAQSFAHQYRIDHDISNTWQSVVACYEKAVTVSSYAVEGSYGDPDMLEVGNGVLTEIENQSHFSLWSFLSAPLILGNDLRDFVNNGEKDMEISNKALEILTNEAIIQFNQTRPYLPAYHQSFGSIDVLVKVLNDGTSGVLVFNKSEETKNVTLLLSELPSVIHGNPFIYQNQIVTEVWGKEYQIREDMLEITDLAPHEVYVLQFK